MSDRLTDNELGELADYADRFMPSRGLDLALYALAELRARRQADLTAEDREALVVLAERNRCAMHGTRCTDVLCAETQSGVAVLDRLLAQGGGR